MLQGLFDLFYLVIQQLVTNGLFTWLTELVTGAVSGA